MIVIALADSDSYLKWAAATLDRIVPRAERRLIVVANPVMPSDRQRATAVAGTSFAPESVEVLSVDDALESVRRTGADVVLVAMRGPLAALLLAMLAELPDRPVLASGIPGIALPARRKALIYRAQADLVLVHSHHERRAYAQLDADLDHHHRFALTTLPFLERRPSDGDDVVFAAQSLMPATRADRLRLVQRLADAARHDPHRSFIIKVRAMGAERQTHDDRWPLESLLLELPDVPPNLQVRAGSMTTALDGAGAVVSVSSTALIEAVARGIPALVLDDFGVSDELLNSIFEGSGLLGSTDDLVAGRFAHADPDWSVDNYLHDPDDDDATAVIRRLVDERTHSGLVTRPSRRSSAGGSLRRAWDRRTALGRYDGRPLGLVALAIGVPVRGLVRLAQRWRKSSTSAVPAADRDGPSPRL